MTDMPATEGASAPQDPTAIREEVIKAIATVYDPEIPVNIWELGLVYGVDIAPTGLACVTMTLTSPHCPEAQSLPVTVRNRVMSVPGVTDAMVEIVWEPPWDPSKMSESAKLALNML
jgi:FeS assembly SUF system protein